VRELVLNACGATHDTAMTVEYSIMPALNRLALGHFRKMEWDRALDYAKQSLAIDTYDPLANYIFGLVNRKMGNRSDAISGFSIAAASPEYRSSAYTELSRLYLAEEDFIHALEYSEKATSFNTFNLSAYEIMAMVCRYTHNYDKAGTILQVIRDLDPTHHFITFEDYFRGTIDADSVIASVQNELPHESFIEGALTYINSGKMDDARSILEMAPGHPIVHLWLAYLDPANAQEYLRKVMDASPFLVFPFRDETAGILEILIRDYDHWKLKYYLGLIYWNKGRINEAKDLFLNCNAVDYAPFFLAKAELFKDQHELQEQALQMAYDLDPEEWRVSHALFEYYYHNQQYKQALEYIESPLKAYPENAVLGLSYARGLVRSGQYKKSISFLESFNVLPFEGATYGRDIYHEACLRLAFQYLEKGDFKKTIQFGIKSLQWPENLGAGKPYTVDERMEHVMIAHSFSMLRDQDSAVKYFHHAAEFEWSSGMTTDHSNLIFQLMALDQLNMDETAEALLTDHIEAYPDNKVLKWVKAAYENNPDALRNNAEILGPSTQSSMNTESPGSDNFGLVLTLWHLIQNPKN